MSESSSNSSDTDCPLHRPSEIQRIVGNGDRGWESEPEDDSADEREEK